MATTPSPVSPNRVNRVGLEASAYKGLRSTLCPGCGHNAISERIIEACFELGIEPHRVAKLSGIGCSSKSPAYFLGTAYGVNALHGRMPPIATGAMLANHHLIALGVSGDGDTASIGIGHFIHLMRRNLPVVYIIEDNGVYGLTKGQFSATATLGSKLKSGVVNELPAVDTCALAILGGATYVARSFSGDKKQLLALLKAALVHRGTSMLDVISPCVTFNDHEGSTKSYSYVQDHDEPLGELNFIPFFEDITADYEPGTTTDITLYDGSHLLLRKLTSDYDPTDATQALRLLTESHEKGEIITGLLYFDPDRKNLIDLLNLTEDSLASLPESKVRPPKQVLDEIMEELK